MGQDEFQTEITGSGGISEPCSGVEALQYRAQEVRDVAYIHPMSSFAGKCDWTVHAEIGWLSQLSSYTMKVTQNEVEPVRTRRRACGRNKSSLHNHSSYHTTKLNSEASSTNSCFHQCVNINSCNVNAIFTSFHSPRTLALTRKCKPALKHKRLNVYTDH